MPAERGRGTRRIRADAGVDRARARARNHVCNEPHAQRFQGVFSVQSLHQSEGFCRGGAGSPAFIGFSPRRRPARGSLALNAYSPPAQRLPPLSLLLRPGWCGTRHIEPSHASLSAIAGLTWAALPAAEKAFWHLKAKEERERHHDRERFPEYMFRPHRRNRSSVPATNSRRRQREVPPADHTRQEHIASLLLTGLSGEVLAEAITKFDAERRGRGEGGVQVRFDVVDTPDRHVVARGAGHKAMQKGERSMTGNTATKDEICADLQPSSSPPLSTRPVNSDFSLNMLRLNNDSSANFEWPYSHSPSTSFPSSSGSLLPFDMLFLPSPNVQLYPCSLALRQASSASASLGSSVESLSTYEMGLSPLLAGGSLEQGSMPLDLSMYGGQYDLSGLEQMDMDAAVEYLIAQTDELIVQTTSIREYLGLEL
ncbi:hypothetical protein B0H13DRAFT_1853277 [Mycena leptocephala]|nr:hypothetical protein B0H13DRAFT_1853277 [Mycena leptocephala]